MITIKENFILNEDETLDDLQYNNLYIIQKKHSFRFGTDPVLLVDFAKVNNNHKIADFGAGTGIISILASQKALNIKIFALEYQQDVYNLLNKNIEYNNLGNCIKAYNINYIEAAKYLGNGMLDLVICNPPYGRNNSTIKNNIQSISVSKHEGITNLDETVKAINSVLKYGGKLAMCIPSERLIELISILKHNSLEPKRIRFVHSYINKEPYLVLVEAMSGGKPGLRVMPALIIHNNDSTLSDEINRIYHKI